jgi:hypothetical protein
VPGKYPFYCDNIKRVTRLVRGRYGGQQQDQIGKNLAKNLAKLAQNFKN